MKQQYLTVPSATAGHSRRRRRPTHVAVAWPGSPESHSGAQVTDRRAEPAGEVILSAATLQSSAGPAPSPSSSTSGCGGGGAGSPYRPADAGSGSAQGGGGPAPGRGAGSGSAQGGGGPAPGRSNIRRGPAVDVVATMAMVALLVTFVLSFTPFLALRWFDVQMKSICVLMPGERILILISLTISGGIRGILNPLVCVVFSSEFRKVFWQICGKFERWLSGVLSFLQ